MYKPNALPNSRLGVADSLRAIAVAGIILLHTLEHSGYFVFPEQASYNQTLWDISFFLLSNKMYAIFSILFGLSFFIQFDNQARKSLEMLSSGTAFTTNVSSLSAEIAISDFRPRFAWRMLLLFFLGMINCSLYNGDILMIYSIGGILLIPLITLPNRTIFIMMAILFVQPVELVYLVCSIFNPETPGIYFESWRYFVAVHPAMEGGTFLETCVLGLNNALFANVLSALECGRLSQTIALFLLGIVIGRKRLLYNEASNTHFWRKVMIYSIPAFATLYSLWLFIPDMISNQTSKQCVTTMLNMWKNLSMILFYISSFFIIYYTSSAGKYLKTLSFFGRMSLTNYLMFSLIGGFLFYNWGYGGCRHFTHIQSLMLGLVVIMIQMMLCRIWTRFFKRGPVESLWRKATWIFSNR